MRRWTIGVALMALTVAGCDRGSEEEAESSPASSAEQATEAAREEEEPSRGPSDDEPIQKLEPLDTNQEKVLLGRRLFHDTALSGDDTVACASCHSLDHGGAEARRTSLGIRDQEGPINSPTVLNAVHNFAQFWDGRAADLAEQAAGPVTNPIEMGATWEQVVSDLKEDESYVEAFSAIYEDGITKENIIDAIVEYERYLVTPAPFDRWLAGDEDAISDRAREGYALFKSVGCTTCHTGVNVGGTMFQKLGLVNDYFESRGTEITEADLGRFNVTQDEADRHKFKVPTLRNVELTAPYFHDGSQETLEEAVTSMAHLQLGKELSDEEVGKIIAFLESLTGELPELARMPESAEEEGAEAQTEGEESGEETDGPAEDQEGAAETEASAEG